jgi:flagellar FliJ protein
MAFKFTLAAVLKYREELEKREERTLELRREALTRLETQLKEAQEQRRRLLEQRDSLLKNGMLGDDLAYATEQEQQLKILEADLRERISAAVLDYENQMQVFLVARQKREILDELKNTKKESYLAEQERREQQTTDEIFIARFNRET